MNLSNQNLDGDTYTEITIKNRTDINRVDWCTTCVPFPKGLVLNEADLKKYTINTGTCDWSVLKRHSDGSVAIGKFIHAVLDLPPHSETKQKVFKWDGPRAQFGFSPGLLISRWLGSPGWQGDVFLRAKFPDNPNYFFGFLETASPKILDGNVCKPTIRMRSHFKAKNLLQGEVVHPCSITTYLTPETITNNCDVSFVIGNDTREIPLSNIVFESLDVVRRKGFRFELKNGEAFGFGPWTPDLGNWEKRSMQLTPDGNSIADGQTILLRGRLSLQDESDPLLFSSAAASFSDPLIGLPNFETHESAQALGVGVIPARRFTDKTAMKEQLEPISKFEGPFWKGFGYIDVAPGSTGAQADFSCSITTFAQQAIQAETSAPILQAWGAIDKECQRPSFYWETRQGFEDRVLSTNYLTTSFWVGKPHYADLNQNIPEWYTRGRGFNTGNSHYWAGQDDQHYSINSVQNLYELTGDPYLGDILKYYVSVCYWDYFNPTYRAWHFIDADRAARTMKTACMLIQFCPDAPEAVLLKNSVIEMNREEYLPAIRAVKAKYGLGFMVLTDACDDRQSLNGLYYCDPQHPTAQKPSEQFPYPPGRQNPAIVVGWGASFMLEFQAYFHKLGYDTATSKEVMLDYIDSYNWYFNEDEITTRCLASDPSIKELGGIGHFWWSGFLIASQLFLENENAQKIQTIIKPKILQALEEARRPGEQWVQADGFRVE